MPAALGAALAGLLVSNHYETASLGQRIDHTVARSEQAARDLADGLQRSAQIFPVNFMSGGRDCDDDGLDTFGDTHPPMFVQQHLCASKDGLGLTDQHGGGLPASCGREHLQGV